MSAEADKDDPVDDMVHALEAAMLALDLRLTSGSGAHVFNGATAVDDLARSLLARRVLAPSMASAEAGTLDEAWAAAEAALPYKRNEVGLTHFDWNGDSESWWVATGTSTPFGGETVHVEADGPTPAAALLALAAALRAVPA